MCPPGGAGRGCRSARGHRGASPPCPPFAPFPARHARNKRRHLARLLARPPALHTLTCPRIPRPASASQCVAAGCRAGAKRDARFLRVQVSPFGVNLPSRSPWAARLRQSTGRAQGIRGPRGPRRQSAARPPGSTASLQPHPLRRDPQMRERGPSGRVAGSASLQKCSKTGMTMSGVSYRKF